MPYHHPYKPNKPDDEPRGQQRRTAYTGMPDLDDALHDVVQTGTGLGAEVLGAVGSALRSVGEALRGNKLTNKNVPFPTWRKRLDHFLKEEKQDGALAVAIVGWVFAALFGIAALVMFILAAGNLMTAGFDQVFNLSNPATSKVAETLDMYIYRITFTASTDFGFSTAVSLFRSIINMTLLVIANKGSKMMGGTGLFG